MFCIIACTHLIVIRSISSPEYGRSHNQPHPNLIDTIVFSGPGEGATFLKQQNETVRESNQIEHAALIAVMGQCIVSIMAKRCAAMIHFQKLFGFWFSQAHVLLLTTSPTYWITLCQTSRPPDSSSVSCQIFEKFLQNYVKKFLNLCFHVQLVDLACTNYNPHARGLTSRWSNYSCVKNSLWPIFSCSRSPELRICADLRL